MNETNEIVDQVPAKCEICGRQDDTVRYVSYPYVFSFIVVTFQRAFTGCWCRLHRAQRWFSASFITSIFGWLGIPFGIVLTPVRLLQLARGGLLDNNVNGQILRAIGEQKLHNGDTQGAIRCFEASMMYVDDPWVDEQLRNLYRSQASDNESPAPSLMSLFVFPSIAIAFVLIGMFVGMLDFIVRWLSSFLPPELSIFVLILLQVPFVVLVYFCVSLLSYVFQSIIRLTRVSSVLFLSVAGWVISLLFINGIVSGGTYGQYFNYFVNGVREQPDEIFTTLAAILTRGGPYIFNPAFFASNFFGSALFAVLIFLSFVLFILVLMPTVKIFAVQQDRIARPKGTDAVSGRISPMFGWIGLIGLIIVFALLFAATPQKSSIDALEAFDHVGIGYNYMTLSQPDQAIAEYRAAIELKPRFALAHILLGNAYLSLGEADKSHDSFLTAATLEPENTIIHSGLGWSYYQQGKNELAESKFLEALGFDAQNLDAHLGLGWVYLQDEDYDLAGRKFNDALSIDNQNLSGHLGLGWVYLNLFDLENSRKEFEYVKSIAPEFAEAYFGLGALELSAYDFDSSIDLMDEALRLNPNLPGAYYFKGLASYRQGKYSDAEAAFQSALILQRKVRGESR
jgi:Tfp pilus assembly protein PilF